MLITSLEGKAQEFQEDSVLHNEQWYQTIQIGQHTWLKEDVRFLPELFIPGTSDTLISKPRAAVTNVLTSNQNHAVNSTQGNNVTLYNFQAIQEWDLCPAGWHISNESDWRTLGQDLNKPFSKADSWGTSSSPTLGNWIAIDDYSDPIATSDNLYCTNEDRTNVTGLSLMPGGVFDNSTFAHGLQDDWPFCIGHYWVINSKDVRIITYDDDNKPVTFFSDAKQAAISFGDGEVTLDPMSNDLGMGMSVRCVKD